MDIVCAGCESLGQPVQYASILPGLACGFRFPELRSVKPRANCLFGNALGVSHACLIYGGKKRSSVLDCTRNCEHMRFTVCMENEGKRRGYGVYFSMMEKYQKAIEERIRERQTYTI